MIIEAKEEDWGMKGRNISGILCHPLIFHFISGISVEVVSQIAKLPPHTKI